jgi:hypothetical protein
VARERTADDQVLALLARTSLPLERAEIEQLLGWTKSMAGKVLLRLVLMHRLEVTLSESTGLAGRPRAKYSLKTAESPADPAAGVPLEVRFEKDTVVVTPLDREARVVLHRRDGFVELEYLDGPRSSARAILHASRLRAFQPGRARPLPYRVPG